jgi:hypothetical protein
MTIDQGVINAGGRDTWLRFIAISFASLVLVLLRAGFSVPFGSSVFL